LYLVSQLAPSGTNWIKTKEKIRKWKTGLNPHLVGFFELYCRTRLYLVLAGMICSSIEWESDNIVELPRLLATPYITAVRRSRSAGAGKLLKKLPQTKLWKIISFFNELLVMESWMIWSYYKV
jgi:hypothetical protein